MRLPFESLFFCTERHAGFPSPAARWEHRGSHMDGGAQERLVVPSAAGAGRDWPQLSSQDGLIHSSRARGKDLEVARPELKC